MREILALLLVHFVADFVLQSDWMAQNKSKQLRPLLAHVAVYAACFVWWGPWFVAVTFLAHLAQDAVTSRINARLWFFRRETGVWMLAPFILPKDDRRLVNPWIPIDGRKHWFFVGIGADQYLHVVQLLVTLQVLR